MNLLKTLALILFLPVAAQAAPLIEGGTNNDIYAGETYSFQTTGQLLANSVQNFSFALTPYAPAGSALSAVISISGGSVDFSSFTLTGPGGLLGDENVVEGPLGNGFIAQITNIAFVLGQPHTLNLAFSLTDAADALVNVQITAVPLPAAGLLLIGAIGGLGALRARRSLAA
jgi:hypothetical protein